MANTTDADDLQNILSEQQSELMAAKTLNSDLDFAFNLQMQEAIKASLALQPSSSRSPPPSPSPADVVSISEGEENGVLDLAATLLLEDVSRFAQEHFDHEECENEMRKTKEDLDRRIHDQNFANYLRSIPDDDWNNYGDNYERPYRVDKCSSSSSSSSSTILLETECFRVYTKGLISEERIRDMKVRVAGLGVAICDPRDNLIFEVKKLLEVMVDGKELSSDCAELEALVEGLKNARTLDLKRVTFFCDDYMLYQYVTGRVQPRQSRMAALVNEVAHFQGKFNYCNPSLVARNDIKFAFKYARDAIVSQITWPEETSNGKKNLKETCIICFEDVYVDQMFSVDDCHHRYCFSCMKQHVEVKLLNGMVANCPREGCKSLVNVDSCGKFLEPKIIEVVGQRMKEASIPVSEKVYCPYPRCSALMSKMVVLEYTKESFIGPEQSGARKCTKCHLFFCINCKVPWHYDMSCYDFKRSNTCRREDSMLHSLANNRKWRQCAKCNHMVELAEGCYHITCRCGYEFCYTCGAPWKNKKPTCKCQLWDEPNIIRNVRRRQ